MSKNFEEEYHKMLDSEIPDLWDRIEAQLSDRPAVKETPKRKVNIRRMSAVIMAAAALLGGVVVLPVIITSEGGRKTSENASPSFDAGAGADFCEESAGCSNEYTEKPAASSWGMDDSVESQGYSVYDYGEYPDSVQADSEEEYLAAESSEEMNTSGSQISDPLKLGEIEERRLYRIRINVDMKIPDGEGNDYLMVSVLSGDGDAIPDGVGIFLREPGPDEEWYEEESDFSLSLGGEYSVVVCSVGDTLFGDDYPDLCEGLPHTDDIYDANDLQSAGGTAWGIVYDASVVFVIYDITSGK